MNNFTSLFCVFTLLSKKSPDIIPKIVFVLMLQKLARFRVSAVCVGLGSEDVTGCSVLLILSKIFGTQLSRHLVLVF